MQLELWFREVSTGYDAAKVGDGVDDGILITSRASCSSGLVVLSANLGLFTGEIAFLGMRRFPIFQYVNANRYRRLDQTTWMAKVKSRSKGAVPFGPSQGCSRPLAWLPLQRHNLKSVGS
jgi:hypothetical protein